MYYQQLGAFRPFLSENRVRGNKLGKKVPLCARTRVGKTVPRARNPTAAESKIAVISLICYLLPVTAAVRKAAPPNRER